MGTCIVRHLQKENRFVRFCDFCGSAEQEAKLLIASPNGNHICDDCVDVCSDVVADQRAELKRDEP